MENPSFKEEKNFIQKPYFLRIDTYTKGQDF